MLLSSRLILRFDEGSMSFPHVRTGISPENAFRVGQAINSLQSKQYKELIKVDTIFIG